MADITRDSFDESKVVTKKILQTGVFVLDSDFNEQADVNRYSDRRILSALTEHSDKVFGEGFKVAGTGASLEVTIKAGFGAFQIDTDLAVLLRLENDFTLTGFSAWPAPNGGRTDYVYLDIEEVEIDPTTDPNLVNPTVGQETCRDLRLQYTISISSGSLPGSAPAGHTYVVLASIFKITGSTIDSDDVTNLIPDHYDNSLDEFGSLNVARNGQLDLWSNGDSYFPDFWTGSDIMGIIKEETTVLFGAFSGKIQCNSGFINPSATLTISNHVHYAGKTMKFVAYLRLESANSGRTCYIKVTDGVSNYNGASAVLNSTTWTKLELEATINDTPTHLQIRLILGNTTTENICVDGVGAWIGKNPRDFEVNPLDKVALAQQSMQSFSYTGSIPASATTPIYKDNISGDGFPVPFDCIATTIMVYQSTGPTVSGKNVYTVKNDGIVTGLTADVNFGDQTGEGSGTEVFRKGDRISVEILSSANPGSGAYVTVGLIPLGGVE